MDRYEAVGIRDCDLIRRDPYNGTILFMEGVNVVHSSADCGLPFEHVMGDAGVPWSWDVLERVAQPQRIQLDVRQQVSLILHDYLTYPQETKHACGHKRPGHYDWIGEEHGPRALEAIEL